MRVWCLGALLALVALSGCSALFDGSRHVGSGADAGTDAAMDAQTGRDAAGAGGASHTDCLEMPAPDAIVCRPSPMGGFCAPGCNAAEECDGRAGLGEHPFGTVCVRGVCGCEEDAHCPDPFFGRCFMGGCAECVDHPDCDPMGTSGPPTFCVEGLCEPSTRCTTDAQCADPLFPNCFGPPGERICVPPCRSDTDCPGAMRCAVDMGGRCVSS